MTDAGSEDPGDLYADPILEAAGAVPACGYRDKEVAAGIGMSPYALSGRLNGSQRWRSDEIEAVCELLEIGQEEIGELFFPEVEQNKKPAGAENTDGLRVTAI